MSNEFQANRGEPVTGCHGFQQAYDFLVRLKGGGNLPPPFGNLKELSQ